MRPEVDEKERQEGLLWSRTAYQTDYNAILGYYKVKSCIEHSHGPAVLDLACGDGLLTEIFGKHFERVVGVDASGAHLAKAKERVPEVQFYESLIEDFNIEEKFDSVFMLDILEHVRDPIFVLQKAASFLKEDGIVIVQVPNAHGLNRKIAVLMGTLERCEELSPFDIDIAGHRRYYTLGTLKEDIEKAGLDIVETGGIFYKMLSTPQIDWFLKNGLWEDGGHGWGRTGAKKKDWRAEFCRACYEIGKERPEDCNIIYACIRNTSEGLAEE